MKNSTQIKKHRSKKLVKEKIDINSLLKENKLLKNRILQNSNSFFSQAHFFQSLLTLNEIHLLQSIVESSVHFLNADRVSLYKYIPEENIFKIFSFFDSREGVEVNSEGSENDRILHLVKKSKSSLTIREILNNKKVYELWQSTKCKSLVYSPIFIGTLFWGILTIDAIKFHNLNIETIKNANILTRLIGLALKNVKNYQKLIAEKNHVRSKLLSEHQQFLKSLNFEFKRARRTNLPLSLISVVLESKDSSNSLSQERISLMSIIRKICEKNLREVDMIFEDEKKDRLWIILPITNFNGLSFIMERLNLNIYLDLAKQSNYFSCFGFCSMDESIKQPKQMIQICNESHQLHRTVRSLINEKKENSSINET